MNCASAGSSVKPTRGRCRKCGRRFALLKGGQLAQHMTWRREGFDSGVICQGSGRKP